MVVPVLLNLVIITLVIIPMNICIHDLMIIRLAIVRAILRADERRGQCCHRESRQSEQCRFPKMLVHIAFLVLRLVGACYGYARQAATPRCCQLVSARAYARLRESTHPSGC